jgi:hypothetical protein
VYEKVGKSGCDLVESLYIYVLSSKFLFVSIATTFVYNDLYGFPMAELGVSIDTNLYIMETPSSTIGNPYKSLYTNVVTMLTKRSSQLNT